MEDLEWDFRDESDRDRLVFSNKNKNVKHVGEDYARIKLKNKTINNDKEYNIAIKNEILPETSLQEIESLTVHVTMTSYLSIQLKKNRRVNSNLVSTGTGRSRINRLQLSNF